ncbi:MAG: hypothetical protein ACLP05_08840, partial [Candidatus Kryptoniota bacterium]
MKQNFMATLFFLFLLCLPQIVQAQQKEMSQKPVPSVSFFLSGDYYSPNFRDVNAVYNTIEKNYYLPAGGDFKDYYSVMGGIKFALPEEQALQAEFSASLYKSELGNSIGQIQSRNFLQIYYLGGTYLYNIPAGRVVSFFLGAGLGNVWLNTQRSYTGQVGIAQVNGDLLQVHGTGGVEFLTPSGVTLSLVG